MGLHNAFNVDLLWTWRWYNAYNERSGRAHLLYVPMLKATHLSIGNYRLTRMSEAELDSLIRQNYEDNLYRFPSSVREQTLDSPLLTRRYCQRAQPAWSWGINQDWQRAEEWTENQRGICKTCWRYMDENLYGTGWLHTDKQQAMTTSLVATDQEGFNAWSKWNKGDHDENSINIALAYADLPSPWDTEMV